GAVPMRRDGAPSPWLDEGFLAAHAHEVDVLHVHGGYGHLPVVALESWTETVRRLGIPLVVTVHQLRDPAQPSGDRHEGHLAARRRRGTSPGWPRRGSWSWSGSATARRRGRGSCSSCTWRCWRRAAARTPATWRSAGTSAPGSWRPAAAGSPISGPTSSPTAT